MTTTEPLPATTGLEYFAKYELLCGVDISKIIPSTVLPKRSYPQHKALDEGNRPLYLPILVRDKDSKYEIVDGHARYQSAIEAGRGKLDVLNYGNLTDDQVFAIAINVNLAQSPLSAYDTACWIEKWMKITNATSRYHFEKKPHKYQKYTMSRASTLRAMIATGL